MMIIPVLVIMMIVGNVIAFPAFRNKKVWYASKKESKSIPIWKFELILFCSVTIQTLIIFWILK